MRTFAGIDVGAMSLGLALWEVDDDSKPVRLLNAQTILHDGGVHRGMEKTATTRRAAAGMSRRTRRRYRQRRKRLAALAAALAECGYPPVRASKANDPRAPWRIRARLAEEYIADDAERRRLIAQAIWHIARHRGWRNPYLSVETFRRSQPPSDNFLQFVVHLNAAADTEAATAETRTVGQLVAQSIGAWAATAKHPVGPKLRGPKGAMVVRLNQSDLANELHRIFEVQRVPDELAWPIIEKVFQAQSPKGSWIGRIGKDPLPGQRRRPRASKADPAFQEFRVLSVLANLRLAPDGEPLSVDERGLIAELLLGWTAEDAPSWGDVADALGVTRRALQGTARAGVDGEPATRPPLDATARAMRQCKVKAVREWWLGASPDERAALVDVVGGDAQSNDETPAAAAVDDLLAVLAPEDIEKVEAIGLPAGRAAYSRDSLQRMSARMRTSEDDLHASRKAIFGVDDKWHPPVEPINAPLGNGAVDRVTKALARWLLAVEREWGAPERIVIEHVRAAFVSAEKARALERDARDRREVIERAEQRMAAEGLRPAGERFGRFQVQRFLAVQRQNSQCLYCGDTITYATSELDHIVPRKGESGGRSTRENLVAVCRDCNREKSNKPFAAWAEATDRPGVSAKGAIARVRHWIDPPGTPRGEVYQLRRRVIERLGKKEEDDPIDDRAMESVAWMAREVAARVSAHFGDGTDVWVFRGAVTAEARKAAGIDKAFHLMGGEGKQRLDRRHHVVDAAVVALMRPGVAQVLSKRIALRDIQWIEEDTRAPIDTKWREFYGDEPQPFLAWKEHMAKALELLQAALDKDEVLVRNSLRLSPKVGRLHDDTVGKLDRVRLGKGLSAELVDRAATPALWHALTRLEDYEPGRGLPAANRRRIRVNGTWFEQDDEIEFFPTGSAALKVRGGWVALGSTIHHARFYRFVVLGKPTFGMVRVFAADIARWHDRDVFSTPLDPGSITMRVTEPRTSRAVLAGEAEYVGWLAPGDEIEIDIAAVSVPNLVELRGMFPHLRRWEVLGFEEPARLNVRPLLLSKEGVPQDLPDAGRKILERSWRLTPTGLVGQPRFRVVRRDALGRERHQSAAHLPTCWSPW